MEIHKNSMMMLQVLSRDKLAKYGMSGMVGALVIMLGFTIMAALNGMGGHSHGGVGGHAEDERHGHAHAHGSTQHGHQVTKDFLSGNCKFINHVHRHDRLFDNADVGISPYDHFHEEYDLDHGDHVHHIEPHNSDNHDNSEDDDFHFDVEDYSTEDQDKNHSDHHEHHSINHAATHESENASDFPSSDQFFTSQKHVVTTPQNLEQGHSHHLEDHEHDELEHDGHHEPCV